MEPSGGDVLGKRVSRASLGFSVVMNRVSALRLGVVFAAALNALLALLLALAVMAVATHVRPAFSDSKGPEGFASAMFMAGFGLAAGVAAVLLASLAIGCYVIYRRLSCRGRLGWSARLFLVAASVFPVAVLAVVGWTYL